MSIAIACEAVSSQVQATIKLQGKEGYRRKAPGKRKTIFSCWLKRLH